MLRRLFVGVIGIEAAALLVLLAAAAGTRIVSADLGAVCLLGCGRRSCRRNGLAAFKAFACCLGNLFAECQWEDSPEMGGIYSQKQGVSHKAAHGIPAVLAEMEDNHGQRESG